ncbi:hypothetical protein BABINDRAFT_6173 [Babjeviella inositovora NRRL Y-12698]|uniref:PHD-type domain-containing protein n=1 Tax=Babjeviella inositovora NRRL Y-12698 TaxID=984486 RepID=A0A1E3QUW8_9ASCO|nr:uncharacterized protein BABINDRAFT_6173 [Babjeviella inositovora NRRL Y-12698]ODQ81476.1 hypothetical protein BABINDRAFT_6173 [Babjeviella inositovora NRRL Y-12698]
MTSKHALLRRKRRMMDGELIATPPPTLDTKLREERHFRDFYPDLDETANLKVLVVDEPEADFQCNLETIHIPDHAALKKPRFRKIPVRVNDDVIRTYSKRMARFGYHAPKEDSACVPFVNASLRAEYDMDEQDLFFLAHVNALRSTAGVATSPHDVVADPKLSREVFEIAMTFLENEWYNLERRVPPPPQGVATVDPALHGSDDGTHEEDQCCAVCFERDCDNANAIVFCDGCNIAVHQECYGVAFIPEGQWLCRKCMIYSHQSLGVACAFCPSRTGAFKQTDTGLWGHVLCAVWIPELYFANPVYVEPIEGIDAIPRSRWKLNCYVCKQPGGACIQCLKPSCFLAYHATCARRAELYLHGFHGNAHKAQLETYCDRHAPDRWAHEHDARAGIARTRAYFAAISRVRRVTAARRSDTDLFRWKTATGSPIAPQVFADRLAHFLHTHFQLDIARHRALCEQLCRYWTLKRDDKRGAPLIKRHDARQHYGTVDPHAIYSRVETTTALLADVGRLEALADVMVARQEKQAQQLDATWQEIEMVYFPVTYLIRACLHEVLVHDPKKTLVSHVITTPTESGITSLEDVVARCEMYHYRSVALFVSDFEAFTSALSQATPPHYVAKLMKKVMHASKKLFPVLVQQEAELQAGLLQAGRAGLASPSFATAFPGVVVKGSKIDYRQWDGNVNGVK